MLLVIVITTLILINTIKVYTICNGIISNEEYYALESLYNSTNGKNWCWNDKLPIWNFSTYNTGAPCNQNWQGIKCACEFTISYVSELTLLQLCLNGFIPNGIGNLNKLEYLLITESLSLSGSLPETISSMTNLMFLSLYGNNITSTIPSSLYSLTKLLEIDFAFNLLTGSISNEISQLKSLINLHLQYNKLSKSLPASIWDFALLEELVINDNLLTGRINITTPNNVLSSHSLSIIALFDNYFSGEFPYNFININSIKEIQLGVNLLTSSLPYQFFNYTKLENFAVDVNYFTSTFPSILCTLTNITTIDVSINYFTGEICFNNGNASVTSFDNIINSFQYGLNFQEVFLENNSFTGTISPNICKWKYLTDVYFSYNLLSGSIPAQLGSKCLPDIEFLYLFNNKITGRVPDDFSELTSLREILIQNNKLTGDLNDRINHTNQQYLSSIDMSNNKLTSTIPSDIFLLTNIESIILTSNCFTGTLPSTVCQANNSLISLLFDGLSSSSDCKNKDGLSNQLQSIISIFDERGVYGTIPSCLFNMPYLSTLHLSGNLFSGTLSDIQSFTRSSNITINSYSPINTNLSDLSLANNRLHGRIPLSFQLFSFGKQLLLSNNEFSGTLIDNFMISPTQTSLSLSVNRLSGKLPNSFLSTSKSNVSLNVLSGNIFACSNNNLPTNDPDYKSYSCGSNNLNSSVFIFLILLCVLLIILISAVNCECKYKWNDRIKEYASYTRIYLDNVTVKDLRKSVESFQSFNNPIRTNNNHNNSMISMSDITMSTISPINTKFNYLSSYPNTLLFADSLRWFQLIGLGLVVFLLVILLPVNLILASSSSIYTYQYGWIISMVLQHGIATSLVYMILIIMLLISMKILMYSQKVRNELWLDERSINMETSDKTMSSTDNDIRSKIQYNCKLSCLFLLVQIVNIVVTISVQVSYVQDGLSNSNLSTIDLLCLQVSIGLFKVFWGITFIPWSYNLLVSAGFSSLFSIQSRLFMSLINYIISPVLATLISNKSCYYFALNGQSDITSSFDLPLCQDILKIEDSKSYYCLKFATEEITTSFQPTFIYSYTCGSALLTAYIPVILYSYVATGLILPLLRYPMMKLQLQLKKSSDSIELNGIAIIVTLMQHLTVLLTFGLSYPVLGVVIIIAIFTESLYCQLLIGYSIKMQLLHVIESQIDRAWRVVNSCSRLVICTVSVYWGFLLFDMLGDEYGAITAILVLMSFIGFIIILVLVLTPYIVHRDINTKTKILLLYDSLLSRYMILSHINQIQSNISMKKSYIVNHSNNQSINSFGINSDADNITL